MFKLSKKSMLGIGLAAGLQLAAACRLPASDVRVTGVIVDAESRTPVATARLLARQHNRTHHAFSDSAGRFRLAGLQPGVCQLTVERYGYHAASLHLSLAGDTSLVVRLTSAPLSLPAVTVHAGYTRERQIARSTQPLTIFTTDEIRRLNPADAGELLAFVPGVMIKDYGGMGGLKTISLRGGPATQTPILIDGLRYDNFQSGTTDLATIAPELLGGIEVHRGGNAARYGADAVTGVVNLQPLLPQETPAFLLSAGRGSAGQESGSIGLQQRFGAMHARLAWAYRAADGDFAYTFDQFGEQQQRRRRNAEFSRQHGSAILDYEAGDVSARTTVLYFDGSRSIPGPALQGNVDSSQAVQTEADFFASTRLRWRMSAHTSAKLWTKFRQSTLHYRDPLLRLQPGGIDDHYRNRDGMVAFELSSVARSGHWQVRGEGGVARLQGDRLARPLDRGYEQVRAVDRRFGFAVLAWEQGLHETPGAGPKLLFDAALRFSHYSDVGSGLYPAAGINWQPAAPPFRLRFHASHNLRAPTFAEQYFLNYGNQRIRPERSTALDLGANYRVDLAGPLMLDASLFAILTRDQIVAVPLSPVQWRTQNLGRTRSIGFELAGEWRHRTDYLHLLASYSRQEPRDRTAGSLTFDRLIPYMPQEIFAAVANASLPLRSRLQLQLGSSLRYASHRFHLPGNDSDSALPAHTIVDAHLGLSWQHDTYAIPI